MGEERAKLLSHAVRRRDRQRRRQEHHRVRRVRRPRRHRRPAAHHRHGLAPCAPPERSGPGRPGTAGQGPEVRRREEPRLARHQAARRRPVARRLAPLPERHAPVRQGHQHRRLRRVRRDRAGHRRPGARLRDGLDQQERRPEQDRLARRRGRGHGPRDRRGQAPHQPRHEAVQGQPVGRVLRPPCSAATASRARSSRSPTSASSSAWRPASTAWCTCPTCPGTSRAKPRCATTRRARKSKPSCWPSTSSASASRSASSSSTPTRSPATPRSTTAA